MNHSSQDILVTNDSFMTLDLRARQLESLFKSAPASICQLRRIQGELTYEYVNPAHEKLTARKDFTGKKLYDVFPEIREDREGIYKIIESAANQGISHRSKELPIRLDWDNSGRLTTRYLDISYEPIFNKDGEPEGLTTFSFDVTDQVLLRKQLELAKLEVENERENFRNLFKQTPEMVCILQGPDHVFEFVNEAHIKVLGTDATGKSVREAQPESVEVHGILDDVYRTGVTAELYEIPVTVGNRLRYFNLTYAARRDTYGTINGIMILGTEVTEEVLARMKIEESEERLRFALAAGSMGTWTVNINTAEVWLSEESKTLFGVDDVPGDVDFTIESVIHPEDRAHAKKDLQDAISKLGFYTSEYRIIRPLDGKTRWILATGNVTYDSLKKKPNSFSGIIMDITDRKKYEADLQWAKEQADAANQLKSAFLANMSHEIRTPLGVVMGFADLLSEQDLEEEDRKHYTKILRRNGEQLSVIVNDILDLSKVEAGFLQVEALEFSLHEAVEEVMSGMMARALDKGILLKSYIDASAVRKISSDPVRLKQILTNLLSNAVKFTAVGTVKLHISASGDQVYFQVSDTGIGISPEQQQRLFKPFTQADISTTRKFGGTGLGLALSKRLAALLGGDLELQHTEMGLGSTFLLTITNRTASESVAPVSRGVLASERTEELKDLKVLVVEDSSENQFLIKKILTNEGVEIEIAENGLQGFEKALKGDHHLIIMDVQMPTMDGYTATQKLRDSGYRKPIIALTAHAMSETRKKCLDVGYSDYLTKPLNFRELVNKVKEYSHKVH